MATVFLKPGKEDALQRRHPWIFSGAIDRTEGAPQDGDVVEVSTFKGRFLALGHFNTGGSIAVRLLSFEKQAIDLAFWETQLRKALQLREVAGLAKNTKTNAYRLTHGEGDGLPGLIIDIYHDTAVLQAHSSGMHRAKDEICQALRNIYGKKLKAVYDKSHSTLPPAAAAQARDGYLFGEKQESVIKENGMSFSVDWETGQKTGFFLDQRENRALLARYAPGKKVLNAFSYSGGFSVYALQAGAELVHSVDVSTRAVDLVNKNMELNKFPAEKHEAFAEDVLKYLKNTEEMYDIVVLDPPAFAKSMAKRHNAVQGYKRLNAEGIKRLKPGGVLFTFSCSQVIDRDLFYNTIVAAAIEAGRPAQVMHHLSQGPDHPVSLFHPEGEYLKGLVVLVQ